MKLIHMDPDSIQMLLLEFCASQRVRYVRKASEGRDLLPRAPAHTVRIPGESR